MKNGLPEAGDGIVVLDGTDDHFVVRGVLMNGMEAGTPTDDDRDVIGVFVMDGPVERRFYNGTYRMETFLEYCSRNGGFGRTPWFVFVPTLFTALAIGSYCLMTPSPFSPEWSRWAAVGLCYLSAPMWVLWTWLNFTGKFR